MQRRAENLNKTLFSQSFQKPFNPLAGIEPAQDAIKLIVLVSQIPAAPFQSTLLSAQIQCIAPK
jgi:hypothetical protein